jgi:hypothetical protein
VNTELEAAIAAVKAAHPGRGWTAGELAPHLPEYLQGAFWEAAVDRYLTRELAKLKGEKAG